MFKFDSKSPLQRNAVTALVLFLIALPGYLLINAFISIENAPGLDSGFDDMIPFLSWTIAIYDWIYIIIFLPIFTIRDFALFKAVAKAYMFVIFISLCIFLIFPVKMERPVIVAPKDFFEWWVWINYTVDRPTTLFPSMHVSNAILSALYLIHWSQKIGIPALIFAIAISLSTLTVKQHFIADVISGFVLSLVVYLLFIAPYIKQSSHLSKAEVLLPEKLALIVPTLGLLATGVLYLIYIIWF